MHRIGNLQRNALIGAALLELIAAAADNGVGEVGLCAVMLYGESQRKSGAVSGVGKMKSLAKAVGKAGDLN